jgi:hypothetical protein
MPLEKLAHRAAGQPVDLVPEPLAHTRKVDRKQLLLAGWWLDGGVC